MSQAQRQPTLFDLLYTVELTMAKAEIVKTAKKSRAEPKKLSALPELFECFDLLHREFADGEPAHFDGAKDGELLNKLLARRDKAMLKRMMRLFFETADPWVRAHGFSIGIFYLRVPALILADLAHRPKPEPHPLLAAIAVRVTHNQFEEWFSRMTVVTDAAGRTTVTIPADDWSWVQRHYGAAIAEALSATGCTGADFVILP
jgi:hypothetical protein